MKTHPKPFLAYILPFLAVIPLTLSFYMFLNALQNIHTGSTLNALSLQTWERLNADLEFLSEQGDAVAQNPSLATHLLNENYETLIATMLSEKETRHIGLIGLANADGYIVTRTKSIASLGEHAFVTAPQGRALAAGAPSVRSIEVNSFDEHQVLMTTGRFVYSDDTKIGALFANYLLDTAYAQQLQHERLTSIAEHAEVGFYTDVYGIYSSSFTDTGTAETIHAYFTPEHLPAANSVSFLTFDGHDYVVKNLSFKGLEGSHTGALIFLPIVSQSQLAIEAFIAALILALISDFVLSRSKR
ncbi:MAG: hypothetical protein QG626_38 [Patescibacteria group bacterium]|jgi:hypothetical protein|nr:hypothetical protein [Patescibacteria group bacterium]